MTAADSRSRAGLAGAVGFLAIAAAMVLAGGLLKAQDEAPSVDDMTAKYHFLSADDTLAVLDEEGKLKGYIEVSQPESESEDVLNYDILEGTRSKNRVQFRTNRIHGKYYRFSGTVERGKGHGEKDPDYLRLIGDLNIVTVKEDINDASPGKADITKESVQTLRVVLKSFGKSERPDGGSE